MRKNREKLMPWGLAGDMTFLLFMDEQTERQRGEIVP